MGTAGAGGSAPARRLLSRSQPCVWLFHCRATEGGRSAARGSHKQRKLCPSHTTLHVRTGAWLQSSPAVPAARRCDALPGRDTKPCQRPARSPPGCLDRSARKLRCRSHHTIIALAVSADMAEAGCIREHRLRRQRPPGYPGGLSRLRTRYARGGGRTHKAFRPADFESAVFAISPPGRCCCRATVYVTAQAVADQLRLEEVVQKPVRSALCAVPAVLPVDVNLTARRAWSKKGSQSRIGCGGPRSRHPPADGCDLSARSRVLFYRAR
jgi:hypothetical protein